MNNFRNRVQLLGHLGMNPEIKVFDSGKKLAKASIATHESYKNAKGEWIKETTWHNLVAWGNTAEAIERSLQKGSEVLVEGRLVNRPYTDKEGTKRHVIEVEVTELIMLNKAKVSEPAEQSS